MILSAGPLGLKFLKRIVERNKVIASSIMSTLSSLLGAGPAPICLSGKIGMPAAVSHSTLQN